MESKVNWNGHTFSSHLPTIPWSNAAGIYIFCGVNNRNEWFPIYIGQATSFAERLSGHERWQEAVELGASHIHAMAEDNQQSRGRIEAELIREFQPSLNEQLR